MFTVFVANSCCFVLNNARMKKFLSNLSIQGRVAVCSFMLALTTGVENLFAQGQENLGNEILQDAGNAMQGVTDSFFKILRIILIFGGAISLIGVALNIFQGERDSLKKAGWWAVGLAVCLGGLAILGMAVTKA